ncbi:hypothetical protein [Heyndrickxia oleronia]|uniref:HK97 gp10 family phage protein n=1 Tax=Heyndrickxia oleronia TaxID=38875 RepID=A0AAW6SNP2_9BACI|nr:hypothetical protein [Heyndrickxia oleronia]MDH5159823.1 hypothetical protein [Heyndrickxia oleronia]
MAMEFKLDLTKLAQLIERSPEAAARGGKQAMDDVKDDWIREARDIAPLDTANLRRQIDGSVGGEGLNSEVIVTGNATAKSAKGKRFNYGYYIHEGHMAADGKSLRHAGTVEQFLDESARKNTDRWLDMIETEIEDELKREGW